MNPGPAPTLLNDWVTPTGFGIIVAILLIAAVIIVIAENLHDRREDDAQDEPEPAPAAYDDTCCIQKCTRPGVVPFNTPGGVLFACRQCAGIVGQWVGVDNRVYDQELDPATDLAKWEKEMPA